MTFKEKLMLEHPECVREKFTGGCEGCPCDYGYESGRPDICTPEPCTHDRCAKCWNREIPGSSVDSIYPKLIIVPESIDLNVLVDKCIEAKTRLVKDGKFSSNDAARLINTMLRMYGRIQEGD